MALIALEISYREIGHGSVEYDEACVFRNRLLRIPLGLDLFDEDLQQETTWVHLSGFEPDGRLVAYLQLKPLDGCTVKMQQVAVAPELQGQGIGRALVERSERVAASRGWREMVLHAREGAVSFYTALGYDREGDRFVEVGVPHFRMRKALG